jgi:hypothetical protein
LSNLPVVEKVYFCHFIRTYKQIFYPTWRKSSIHSRSACKMIGYGLNVDETLIPISQNKTASSSWSTIRFSTHTSQQVGSWPYHRLKQY